MNDKLEKRYHELSGTIAFLIEHIDSEIQRAMTSDKDINLVAVNSELESLKAKANEVYRNLIINNQYLN